MTWPKPCTSVSAMSDEAVLGVDPGRREQLLAERARRARRRRPSSRIRAPCSRTCRTSEKPLECRPVERHGDDDVALARPAPAPRTRSSSTTPTPVPAMS